MAVAVAVGGSVDDMIQMMMIAGDGEDALYVRLSRCDSGWRLIVVCNFLLTRESEMDSNCE